MVIELRGRKKGWGSWGGSAIEHKSVCPTYSEAKRYQNVGVWSKERFMAGPCKDNGWLMPPETPEEFQQSMLKGQVREVGHRVCDQLMHNSLIG